jgi:hypothetical protein
VDLFEASEQSRVFFDEAQLEKTSKRTAGHGAAMRAILPVDRSGWAIASGYLGLLSVLLVFAPFALFTGLVAVWDMQRNPERHGMGRAIFGILMGLLGTFALVALLVLATKR